MPVGYAEIAVYINGCRYYYRYNETTEGVKKFHVACPPKMVDHHHQAGCLNRPGLIALFGFHPL